MTARFITEKERRHYGAILRVRDLKMRLAQTPEDVEQLEAIVGELADARRLAMAAAADDLDTVPCFKCEVPVHMELHHATEVYVAAISTIPPNEVNSETESFTSRDERFVRLEQPKLVLCDVCLPALRAIVEGQVVEATPIEDVRAELVKRQRANGTGSRASVAAPLARPEVPVGG